MTKKTFDRLLEETKRHWEQGILKASAKSLKKKTPITERSCAVCKYMRRAHGIFGCDNCFLHDEDEDVPGCFHCLSEILDANTIITNYRRGQVILKKIRRTCKKAYKEILKRFEEYEKEHYERRSSI